MNTYSFDEVILHLWNHLCQGFYKKRNSFSCPHKIFNKTIGLFSHPALGFQAELLVFFPFSVQMESKPVEGTQKRFLSAYAFRSKVGNPALVLLKML